MKLHFLGTAGGRYATAKQTRKTAGIILESKETSLYIDPGPGSLVHCQNHNTNKIEGVIVTHSHPDHYTDAESIIELISIIHENPCKLMAPETVLNGYSDLEQSISNYHQRMCTEKINLTTNEETELNNLEIKSQEMFHSEPKTRGLKISDNEKTFGFWTDSSYSNELTDFYKDCDTLIVNCNMPKDGNPRGHISLSDVPKILENSNASTVIITHFGERFLQSDLNKQENWLKNQVDQKVIFAKDNMTFPGDRKLSSF